MKFTKLESLRIFIGYLLGYLGLQLLSGLLYGIYYNIKYSSTVPEEIIPKVGAMILILSSCFVFILLFVFARKKLSFDWSLLLKKRLFGGIIFGFAIIFITNMLLGVVYTYILGIEINPENQKDLNEMISVAPAFMLLSSTILIPFVEEIVFRGVLLEFFEKRLGIVLGILISSFTFGFMHVTDPASFIFLPMYLAPGIIFGILYIKFDRNLWIPIGAHLLNNFIVVMVQIFIS